MTTTTLKETNKIEATVKPAKAPAKKPIAKKSDIAVKAPASKPVAKKPTANKEVAGIMVKPAAVMNKPKDVTVYSKEMVTELKKRTNTILAEMGKVENSFTKIAFNLYWIYDNCSFKALGYDNIYDLAKKEFNIARGTANGFINVVERFGKKADGKFIEEIDDNFKSYKSSQLITMLGMSDEELKKVSADMSVRDIKDLKKAAEKSTDTESDKDSSDSDKETVIDVKSEVVENRTVMLTLKDLDDYYKHKDTIETQIIRALSARGKSYKVEISYTW